MGALGSADVTTVFHFCAYTLAVEYQGKLSIVMGQVGFPVLARTRDAAELTHLHRLVAVYGFRPKTMGTCVR